VAKEKLSWRTLGLIRGGRAGKAIDAAINRVLGDLEDRGDDGAARDVVIRLRLKPVKDGDGITTSVQCKTSMPALHTGSTVAMPEAAGPRPGRAGVLPRRRPARPGHPGVREAARVNPRSPIPPTEEPEVSGLSAEALSFLSEQAVKAGREAVLTPKDEPPGVYYMLDPAGEYVRKETPAPQERRTFSNPDSLAEWAWNLPDPRAWVSLAEVRVTAEDARQSFGVLPVGHSPQLNALLELEAKPRWMDQMELVRFLRTTVGGCLVDASLVATFRNLSLSKNEAMRSNAQQDRASLGKALEAQVTGAGAIPEDIDVNIPMVRDPLLPIRRQPVKLVLETDPVQVRFMLHVYPGDLVRAMRSAELELYNQTVEAVIRNRPGAGLEAIEDDVKRASAVKDFRVYSGRASV
jgi:hypothetical protein